MFVPANPRKFLEIAGCLILIGFALSCGCSPARIIPGGPFISLFGDVIPSFCHLAAIRLGLVTLRVKSARSKVIALGLILIATAGILLATLDAILFWITPHARGSLLGP